MTETFEAQSGEWVSQNPLKWLAHKIAEINRANGWFDQERSLSDEFMLITGEVFEAHEEQRKGKGPAERYYTFVFPSGPIDDQMRAAQAYVNEAFSDGTDIDLSVVPTRFKKPEGIPSEMADIIIRVLDFCYRYEIDIDTVLAEKLAFNATRGHRHGGKRL